MGDGSKVLLATAIGHYNGTLNRCLIRTQITTEQSDGHTSWLVSVKDAFDGKEFATKLTERDHLQDDSKENRTTLCSYEKSEGEQDCTNSPMTFDPRVTELMEGASPW
jgi:hypothetical protein